MPLSGTGRYHQEYPLRGVTLSVYIDVLQQILHAPQPRFPEESFKRSRIYRTSICVCSSYSTGAHLNSLVVATLASVMMTGAIRGYVFGLPTGFLPVPL